MTSAQRDAMSNAARAMLADIQIGDTVTLRANTIPSVAADFSSIASSADTLKPLVQHATITVEDLYTLDASSEPADSPQTDFYCGNPIVVFNFTDLPPAKYAFVILHATGIAQPQQVALILSSDSATSTTDSDQPAAPDHWMLAGFYFSPMLESGHNGLWYWAHARDYAQKKMAWSAWFYYQIANSLLDPVDFLTSPNLVKLQRESDPIRPQVLPGDKPMVLEGQAVNGQSTNFQISSIGTTAALGGLDLDVHYVPDANQLAQLRDPAVARTQVLDLMTSLLALHPDLRQAFRGIWVRADHGDVSVFALDLPMSQIPGGVTPATAPLQLKPPASTYDPTRPEIQPNLTQDHDPILSPDPEVIAPPSGTAPVVNGNVGEIQKGQGGTYTLRENVNEVVLPCTVVDKDNQIVTGLQSSDFRVWEDDVPQTIDSFQYQDLPVSLGILIDNSGSMRDKRSAVDAAALKFIRLSNPKDEAFIVNFSDRAYLDQDFTSNIAALQHGLSHIDSKSTTALYDAVAASADQLAKHAKQSKQILLIITDGADNASRLSQEQAIRRVQGLWGPVVYSVGLLFGDDKDEARRARIALQTLSKETGGIAYFPDSLDQVDAIAGEVARNIREQYTLTYHSTRPAALGGYRSLRVEAKYPASMPHAKHDRLTVMTRRGYYPNVSRVPATGTPITEAPAAATATH